MPTEKQIEQWWVDRADPTGLQFSPQLMRQFGEWYAAESARPVLEAPDDRNGLWACTTNMNGSVWVKTNEALEQLRCDKFDEGIERWQYLRPLPTGE